MSLGSTGCGSTTGVAAAGVGVGDGFVLEDKSLSAKAFWRSRVS